MDPKLLKQYEDELIARVSARDHLTEWIKYRGVGLVPARHHQLIIDELEKVERGETTRLMLALPPGSAKSTYTSVEFPPWFIGRNPKSSVIAASHTLDLAERFGRKARNIVASREFKNVSHVFAWNDYFGPLVYLSTAKENWPISVALSTFNGIYGHRPQIIGAGALLALLAPLLLFVVAQRFFVQGIVITGVEK